MSLETGNRNQNEGTVRKLVAIIAIVTALVVICVLILIIGSIPKSTNNGSQGNEDGTHEQIIDLTSKVKYTEISVASTNREKGSLVLVNSTHEYKFPASESEPMSIKEYMTANGSTQYYGVTYTTIMLRSPALEKADEMLKAFCAATGKDTLMINSAYRTYEEQQGKEIPAGYSDSHTGYGFSVKFSNNDKLTSDPESYAWLKNNCYKYGFVIRYPEGKETVTGVNDYAYYFRYVGYAHAYYMTHSESGTIDAPMTLEEYNNIVKDYPASGSHLTVEGDDGHVYEIYYIKASSSSETTVKVPSNRAYEISGNNDGGFVVTVTLS